MVDGRLGTTHKSVLKAPETKNQVGGSAPKPRKPRKRTKKPISTGKRLKRFKKRVVSVIKKKLIKKKPRKKSTKKRTLKKRNKHEFGVRRRLQRETSNFF